eukprot:6209839-Amphidinium_carterae.1
MAAFPALTPEERAMIEYDTICCQCGKPDTTDSTKRHEICWFKVDCKCRQVFCEEHGRYVGQYKPGSCAMYWCDCHEMVCLPTQPDPWDNVTVDSDGFLDEGYSDTEWDPKERLPRLRRQQMAFQRDGGQPTSTSSEAVPRQPQSP